MIVIVGLSHHTAPIEIREQVVLADDVFESFAKELAGLPQLAEAFIVSTCNRMEIVAATRPALDAGSDGGLSALEEAADAIASLWAARAPRIRPYLYRYANLEAVRHLFRVSCSLDSMVLGEPQILGQVKAAVDRAREANTLGPELERIAGAAFRAAKRVRSETLLGAGQVSVPSIAIELAKQIFGDLTGHCALLVGSGEMGETVALLLRQAGVRLLVCGRNELRVEELSRALGGESRPFSELEHALGEADVIIGTTSARQPILTRDHVAPAMRRRKGRSLFFIDLAVPRDIESSVGELENVYLYNIDDLAEVVSRSLASRQQEAGSAELLVDEELALFERRQTVEQVTPAIAALRRRLWQHLQSELERSLHGKLKHLGDAERQALGVMVEATVKKMLHAPSSRLRALARDGDREALDQSLRLLESLFELELPLGLAQRRLDELPSAELAQLDSPEPLSASALLRK